jgi:hypothetical protein
MSGMSSTTQMWVLEQVADLVIDLERPVIVKEMGIEPFHSHPNIVLQLTTDDYGACLLVVPFVTQARSLSGIERAFCVSVRDAPAGGAV